MDNIKNFSELLMMAKDQSPKHFTQGVINVHDALVFAHASAVAIFGDVVAPDIVLKIGNMMLLEQIRVEERA